MLCIRTVLPSRAVLHIDVDRPFQQIFPAATGDKPRGPGGLTANPRHPKHTGLANDSDFGLRWPIRHTDRNTRDTPQTSVRAVPTVSRNVDLDAIHAAPVLLDRVLLLASRTSVRSATTDGFRDLTAPTPAGMPLPP